MVCILLQALKIINIEISYQFYIIITENMTIYDKKIIRYLRAGSVIFLLGHCVKVHIALVPSSLHLQVVQSSLLKVAPGVQYFCWLLLVKRLRLLGHRANVHSALVPSALQMHVLQSSILNLFSGSQYLSKIIKKYDFLYSIQFIILVYYIIYRN